MFTNKDIKVINGIHGYASTVDNKIKVFLLYEDVLNRLGLIKNQSDQIAVMSIDGQDQYSEYNKPVIDPSKAGIVYMAISNLVNQDYTITNYLPPNPLIPDGYIPVELAVELSRQCRNQQFEMELVQQIIPAFNGSNAINSAMALRSQIESRQNHVVQDQPVFDRKYMFAGSANQIDNAERLYLAYKDTIKYVKDIKKIAIYQTTHYDQYTTGGKWFIDDYEGLHPKIKELAKLLIEQAHTEEEKRIANSLKVSYSNSIGIVRSLSSIDESIVNLPDFDRYPYLLNVSNGVVDLRNGQLLPPDPNLYLSRQAPVAYDPYARSLEFEHFIEEILPDPNTREAVLRYLGYCITGDTSAQKSLFIVGNGANGKSTLLNILSRLLGLDYAYSCSMNFFSEKSVRSKSGPTPERAEFIGRRFIQIDEIKAGEILDTSEFKLLTGSNTIPFRALYGKASVIVNPTHKFIFSGNFLPELGETDGGVIRRLMVAEFPRKFSPSEINPYLLDILTSPKSLSGILNVLVAQAAEYYRYGLGKESLAMEILKEEYVLDMTKRVQSIFKTMYIQDPDSYVLASDLEEQINQKMYPNKLKYGQLRRIMGQLGYEPIRLKSRGEDRDKWAYIGFRKNQNN